MSVIEILSDGSEFSMIFFALRSRARFSRFIGVELASSLQ